MSLYADYLKERLGDDIIELEWGFVTYRFPDQHTVYIVDLYIEKKSRKQGLAQLLADQVCDLAKKRGCTRLIGSVVPSANGSTNSMRVLLDYGMIPDSSTNDFILFKKEIA